MIDTVKSVGDNIATMESVRDEMNDKRDRLEAELEETAKVISMIDDSLGTLYNYRAWLEQEEADEEAAAASRKKP